MVVRNSRDKGFTLLEVMIALAIVATALVTLLGLSNRSILVQAEIQRLTRATLLAQELMSEQELTTYTSNSSWETREDVFDDPYADYRWRISFEDTPIGRVKQVTVTVLWGEVERNEQVQLTSFVPIRGVPQ